MDATALMEASPAIQIHAASAILALAIGTLMLVLRKGTRLHKGLGRTWIGLMLAVALSSFLITEVRLWGPYGPIHILSVFTLTGLYGGWRAAREGNIGAHRFAMISVYGMGLIGAGAFTLLPGRRMNAVVFDDGGVTALGTALACALVLAIIYALRRRNERHGSGVAL